MHIVPCFSFSEFLGMDVRPFTFSSAELKTVTNNFDYANKLGEGGFGRVYKVSHCFHHFHFVCKSFHNT